MPGWRDVANIWKNVREVDLRPIRQEAEREIRIAILSEPDSGGQALAEALRSDPARPDLRTRAPLIVAGLEASEQVAGSDLVILVVDPGMVTLNRYRAAAHQLSSAGRKVVVLYNQGKEEGMSQAAEIEAMWDAVYIFAGPVEDSGYLQKEFTPVMMKLLPDHLLSLGRNFPLFRVPIAQHLINDTCFSNAAYALSTGLAETVPVLNLPLNIADIVVLTKAQAFLVYRLGLALGFSTSWQDYVAEFGSVIGGGFLWRQLARQLVGLIPVWGILPKVAVAYAGTYVVGQVVLRWYLTGRHVSPRQFRELYRQAFIQGKAVARTLLEKAPHPRLGRGKKARLPAPQAEPAKTIRTCPNCGRNNATDARYCQYCGQALPER